MRLKVPIILFVQFLYESLLIVCKGNYYFNSMQLIVQIICWVILCAVSQCASCLLLYREIAPTIVNKFCRKNVDYIFPSQEIRLTCRKVLKSQRKISMCSFWDHLLFFSWRLHIMCLLWSCYLRVVEVFCRANLKGSNCSLWEVSSYCLSGLQSSIVMISNNCS